MAFDPDGGDPESATWLRMELVVAYRGQSGHAMRATR
jgi:hypothetical protein